MVRSLSLEQYLEENKSDFIEYQLPLRFLFGEANRYKRLFWVRYEEEELYMGSSLTSITSSGNLDVQEVQINKDNSFRINVNSTSQERTYNSLKFSFHKSGVRHLKFRNKELNRDEKLYSEIRPKLDELTAPEMLFIVLSKRISLYEDYKKELTKGNTSAILLNTPSELLQYRQVFEFYICTGPKDSVPTYIIKADNPFQYLKIKLKEHLYLYVKYTINSADNSLSAMHPDREILLFNDNKILKSFCFK